MSSRRQLYDESLRERQKDAAALRRRERNISWARLGAAAAVVAVALVAIRFAVIPLALFIALVVLHERTVRLRKGFERRAAFFTRGLSRLDGTWQGEGDPGNEFVEEHHPFADDLDLFGRGSLFERISLAVTRAGRARLASWLRVPSLDAAEITARQEAIGELAGRVALREELFVVTSDLAAGIESADLDGWAASEPLHLAGWERAAIVALPIATSILVLLSLPSLVARLVATTHAVNLHGWMEMPAWPLLLAILATLFLSRWVSARVAPVVSAVERTEPAFALLGALLRHLEGESFESPRLAALRSRLGSGGTAASAQIEKLRRLVALLDARRNQFFAPIAGLLLWTPNVALAIERWRLRSGREIVPWIEAVGEIEALSSLASFAWENPSFAMPEIAAEGPLFDARELGHPLIPESRRVTNDLRLDGGLRLLVVSGSNMSGKSTMMRSSGLAAVLAMAGGPVCAASLRIAPMQVGASIRLHDSLQENASRFFAEILRIRQILEMAAAGPMLFLLDEMLAGTNSHDRRIGAEAVVRSLVERGAVGLISTHDLALAEIADSLAPRAANVHFEDHIENGRAVFDYRMRPGVVTRSNALELMRSVGIVV